MFFVFTSFEMTFTEFGPTDTRYLEPVTTGGRFGLTNAGGQTPDFFSRPGG